MSADRPPTHEPVETTGNPGAIFLNELARLKIEKSGGSISTKDIYRKYREIAEKFVTHQAGATSGLPWLESREKPVNLEIPPCYQTSLPAEYKPHPNDTLADTALVPYAPPLDYLKNPPKELFVKDNAVKKLAYEHIYWRGIDHIHTLSVLDPTYCIPDEKIILKDSSTATQMADTMATWAEEGGTPGVDLLRSSRHNDRLEAYFRGDNGEIVVPSISKIKAEVAIELKKIVALRSEIGDYIDNPSSHPIENYQVRSSSIFDILGVRIDACRWYLDQELALSATEEANLMQTIEQAYYGYHSILQVFNQEQGLDNKKYETYHDISALLGGIKLDVYPRSTIENPNYYGHADYLDAFMGVASYYQTALDYVTASLNRNQVKLDKIPGIRPYFGQFETAYETLRQQLTLMCVLAIRMPESQQEKYQELIINMIDKSFDILFSNDEKNYLTEEKLLYVPSAKNAIEPIFLDSPFNFTNPQELVKAQKLAPLMHLAAMDDGTNLKSESSNLTIKASENTKITTPKGYAYTINDDGNLQLHVIANIEGSGKGIEEVQYENDPAFQILQDELNNIPDLPTCDDQTYHDNLTERRNAIEKFVRTHTGRSSEYMPAIEERLNPPPIDMPPCLMRPLPKDYNPTHQDSWADIALYPHIPPLEYLQNPPNNIYDPPPLELRKDPIDFEIDQMMREILDEAYLGNTDYESALEQIGGWEQIQNAVWTWAQDTRIDGMDTLRSATYESQLSAGWQNHQILAGWPIDGNVDKRFIIPLPSAYQWASIQVTEGLQSLLDEISDKMDDPKKHIERYGERVLEYWNSSVNIINGCRWHLEHNSVPDGMYRQVVVEAMRSAYLSYNTILQTCNKYYDKGGVVFGDFHDISTLMAGLKIDHTSDGRYGETARLSGRVDYFDAFMAVAQANDVAELYIKVAGGIRQADNRPIDIVSDDPKVGARPLLGSFEVGAKSLKQQLVLLSVLYYRMPEWQRETYQEIIDDQFYKLNSKAKLVGSEKEPELFIPSATKVSRLRPDTATSFPYALDDTQDLVRAQYIEPVLKLNLLLGEGKAFTQKSNAHMEVSLGPATEIIGWQSEGAWADKHGFVQLAHEFELPKIPKVKTALENVPEKPKTWLERLQISAQKLSVESRLGIEAARVVKELVKTNFKNGSVQMISESASMMERLLGRKPLKGKDSFVDLLKELGMVNAKTGAIDELNTEQVRELLGSMRTSKVELSDLDEGNLVLLLFGCSGTMPREELAEQVIKLYDSLEKVLTLEAISALEGLDSERRFIKFGKRKERPSVILGSRDKMRDYINGKRADDPDYKPQSDEIWHKMAETTIEQVLKLMTDNKSYDATMKTSLYAVLAAKEDGQLVARCHVDGQLLTAFLKFISPELQTYHASTYGPEELLTLPDWYKRIETAKQSGHETHGFNLTGFINSKGEKYVHLVDATGGYQHEIPSENIIYPILPDGTLRYGEFTHQISTHFMMGKRHVLGQCVTGGSSFVADLAGVAKHLDYLKLANPDSPMLWLSEIYDNSLPIERRALALDRILLTQPRRIAMSTSVDFNRGSTAYGLQSIVILARETGRWAAALFAANILERANFFTPELNQNGKSLRQGIAEFVASLPERQYSEFIEKRQDELVAEEDLLLVQSERQKYLDELERKAQEEMRRKQDIEREFRTQRLAKVQQRIESVCASTAVEASVLITRDHEDQQRDQGVKPTLGYQATQKYAAQISDRATQLETDTVSLQPAPNGLDQRKFEFLSEEAHDKLIETAILGKDGKRLVGPDLEKRMKLIQSIFIAKAYQLTRPEDMDANHSHLDIIQQRSDEQGVTNMATFLNKQFTVAAARLNLSVPSFDPRVELAGIDLKQLSG